MSQLPLNIYAGKFLSNYEDTEYNVFKSLLRRLRVDIPDSRVITGKHSTVTPTSDHGVHFFATTGKSQDGYWRYWVRELGTYRPTRQVMNSTIYNSELRGGLLTATRTFAIPDASGTVMMFLDSIVPEATDILATGEVNINWASTSDFIKRLDQNTTFTFSQVSNGREITVTVENNATSYTVTWPTAGATKVYWPASPTHTQPNGDTGINGVGVYTFRAINGKVYGEMVDFTPGLPNPTVPTGGSGSVPKNYYTPPADNMRFPY